jgi:hypothetical protein
MMTAKMLLVVSSALVGTLLLPATNASAAAQCRETIVNGRVVDRVCTHKPKYRTVCKDDWSGGVKHRKCRKVPK